MKLIRLSFREDPVRMTASLIGEGGVDPLTTLVVTPTQRFKSYLASALLERSGGRELLCPSLLTAQELGDEVLSRLGLPAASDMERLSLLYRACALTPEVDALFPKSFMARFSSFHETARRVLKAFDELNREEVGFETLEAAAGGATAYRDFKKHAGAFRRLYERYRECQDSAGVHDRSFLVGGTGEREIADALDGYGKVLLVEPVSITRFERRVFDRVRDRLTVVYQDADDYDFSGVLTFLGERGARGAGEGRDAVREAAGRKAAEWRGVQPGAAGRAVFYRENPSRVAQLLDAVAVVEGEIARGTPPNGIAVVNFDDQFCEMLRESLLSLGVECNMSGGVGFKRSPLFGFLNLAGVFFAGHESGSFLELVGHPLFLRLSRSLSGGAGPSDERESARAAVLGGRLFRFPKPSDVPLARGGAAAAALAALREVCASKTFDALSRGLESLLERIGAAPPRVLDAREGAVGFDEAKGIVLGTAIALEDCDLAVKETPFELLLERLGAERLPLTGSHLAGVQIIGLLESRGLRFPAVVVPTFNEGFFPSRVQGDVLLNLEMRRSCGLPTVLDREELELYYLKRLVDASVSAYLLAISDPAGEIEMPSRFRSLLAPESGEGSPGGGGVAGGAPAGEPVSARASATGVKIFSVRLAGYRSCGVKSSCEPPPSPAVLPAPLVSLSRFGLDMLKKCETKYYIAEVLRIEPERTLGSGIEPDVVGERVHALFRELYGVPEHREVAGLPEPAGLSGGFQTGGCRERLGGFQTGDFRERFGSLFAAHFPPGLFDTGEELLFRGLLRRNLLAFLDRDTERFRDGFRVCGDLTEKELSAGVGTGPGGFLLSGRIDRVDRSPGGGYLIVDYKTGRLPRKADHFAEKGFAEVQLGVYGLLFRKNFPGRVIDGLGYVDLVERRDLEILVDREGARAYLDEFEAHLVGLVAELNGRRRLNLTVDPAHCEYCPYPAICRVNET